MKKLFSWDAGHASCTAYYKNKAFIGEANCHPDDADFESERVGLYIAETRADIEILRYMRDAELKPAIDALNHIVDSFKRSTYHKPDSYESSLVRRQLHRLETELAAVNNELTTLRLNLRAYINSKEKFYQSIRKGRNKQ